MPHPEDSEPPDFEASDDRGSLLAALVTTLTENDTIGLYMMDESSGRVVYANATAGHDLEMVSLPERVRAGLRHDDVVQHLDTLMANEPTWAVGRRAFVERPDTGKRDLETTLLSGRCVRWLVLATSDDRGRKLRLYVSRDVSERKELERTALERQKRSEAEFRRLLEHVPDGIVVMRDGKFAYANPAAARILGYDAAEELIGVHFASIVRPEELTRSDARVRGMSSGAPPPRSLRPMVRRDGTTVYAETLGFQTELDGAPATLVIAHDVTEERRLEAQMRQAERLASLGTLSATIAHEINNPLTYILLNLQVTARLLTQLAKTSSSPLLTDALRLNEQSLEGAERVRVIVGGLRDFSRGDAGDAALVDVSTILDSVIPMAEHELRHGATLVRDYADVPRVRASPDRLAQVFLNLIVNAAQALPEREGAVDQVVIAVRATGEMVRVSVRDTGVGMSSDVIERVFEPFFTTKARGGTGLGLPLCLQIVSSLGGDIEVESELGKGSTFSVILPAAAPDAEPDVAPTPSADLPRLKILIVDDEPRIAERLGDLLFEHDVVLASSGREALAQLRSDEFDAVFCDLMMPDVKGTDVFEEACREQPAMAERFVFMTAGAFTPSARALLDRVSNPRLDKPFTEKQVQDVLALVIRRAGGPIRTRIGFTP
ncbi:MAG: histidine kinase [Myxococcaceae bacterium]|nr:histidine kinase [Myxococcaceae bacterium]